MYFMRVMLSHEMTIRNGKGVEEAPLFDFVKLYPCLDEDHLFFSHNSPFTDWLWDASMKFVMSRKARVSSLES